MWAGKPGDDRRGDLPVNVTVNGVNVVHKTGTSLAGNVTPLVWIDTAASIRGIYIGNMQAEQR